MSVAAVIELLCMRYVVLINHKAGERSYFVFKQELTLEKVGLNLAIITMCTFVCGRLTASCAGCVSLYWVDTLLDLCV